MNMQRNFTNSDTRQILLEQAKLLRDQAERMPDGVERGRMTKAAEDSEAQAKTHAWVNSSDLQPPTR